MIAAVASQSCILHMLTFTTSPGRAKTTSGSGQDRRLNSLNSRQRLAGAATRLPVLLHAIAAVVELGEGGGQLVQVVAQRVEQQVVQNLQQDLRETEDALAQLPLLLVVQQDLRGLGLFLQSCLVDVGQPSDGPVAVGEGRSGSAAKKRNVRPRPLLFLW